MATIPAFSLIWRRCCGISIEELLTALHTYLRHSVLILIAGLELTSCTTVRTTAPGAVGIEREQHMLVSEGNVEQGAERAYAQELQKARELGKLNQNPELAAGCAP